MTLIIMKEGNHFKPHYNRELGKKYYTKSDYLSDMKSKGLEPFHEVKRPEPKKYTGVSEEAKHMMNSVSYDRKTGKPNIGDRYIDALKSMGMKKVPDNIRNLNKGGFNT